MARTYIPASGVIIDKKNGKVHILNPGKVRNIAQGFYDATGFHPIRSSGDYDSGRLFDDTEGSTRKKAKKKPAAKKKRKPVGWWAQPIKKTAKRKKKKK